ncbi:transcription factor bHLH111 [Punica granatum]|uniref:BHLH domain-containing protein n=2 Tax=Punica granatum TaxID=22663 RepID=A0A218XD54_PUNGR|nr:transcription factor bHLH111 [Punica granatum]OWM82282.1 hypothetical protein CDL15_Pgr001856 [Punica granatum]PKI62043.1 hypothetical protein CRG98_017416 [Punica granatum]
MWDLHNTSSYSLSAWTTTPTPPPPSSTISFNDHYVHPVNPSLSSPCEDDVSISTSSFTNASGHSALTVESSGRPPIKTTASSSDELMIGDHGNNHHLWSHFLLSDAPDEDLHKYEPEIRENLMDAVSSKSASPGGIFEQAACDYLKKLDNSYWDNPVDKEYMNSNGSSFIEEERLSKLSDLLTSDWSIATPHEYTMHLLSDYTPGGMMGGRDSDRHPYKGHDNPSIEREAAYRNGTGKYASNIGLHQNGNKLISCGNTRSLADLISFSSRLISKPSLDVKVPRPISTPNVKSKQGLKSTSTSTQVNGRSGHRSGTTNEGKRKRSSCEDSTSSDKLQKKHKHENSSSVSIPKAPKVKLGDRIATLQQIVSPFGKTDTASVLMEAIAYIKFLQEQVQLLISNPYLKTNPRREYPWGGGLERKEVKVDLRSRGLCLIPVSCAPQVCRDNTGSDYWSLPYRGVFYR